MNIMQVKNLVRTTKKNKGKLPLFCGNRGWVIPFYGMNHVHVYIPHPGYSQYLGSAGDDQGPSYELISKYQGQPFVHAGEYDENLYKDMKPSAN